MFRGATTRWETDSRWYEVSIVRDLLGDWTVWRRWGGRNTRRGGSRSDCVANYAAALERLAQVGRRREHRRVPYRRLVR